MQKVRLVLHGNAQPTHFFCATLALLAFKDIRYSFTLPTKIFVDHTLTLVLSQALSLTLSPQTGEGRLNAYGLTLPSNSHYRPFASSFCAERSGVAESTEGSEWIDPLLSEPTIPAVHAEMVGESLPVPSLAIIAKAS